MCELNYVANPGILDWILQWSLEKGIAEEIENYEPNQLNTLLERSHAEIKNKHG